MHRDKHNPMTVLFHFLVEELIPRSGSPVIKEDISREKRTKYRIEHCMNMDNVWRRKIYVVGLSKEKKMKVKKYTQTVIEPKYSDKGLGKPEDKKRK